MERPIKDWLEELPEPHKTQALTNYTLGYSNTRSSGMAGSKYEAIDFAFWWRASPEGESYWSNFYEDLENAECK